MNIDLNTETGAADFRKLLSENVISQNEAAKMVGVNSEAFKQIWNFQLLKPSYEIQCNYKI